MVEDACSEGFEDREAVEAGWLAMSGGAEAN
jgi:hypothetical protein